MTASETRKGWNPIRSLTLDHISLVVSLAIYRKQCERMAAISNCETDEKTAPPVQSPSAAVLDLRPMVTIATSAATALAPPLIAMAGK